MKSLRLLYVLPLLFALAGCPSMPVGEGGQPLPATLSTDMNIAHMYTAIGAAADTTTLLLQNRLISKQEAQMVLTIVTAARNSANIALDYFKQGKSEDAAASLRLAQSVLREAQTFLTTKQPVSNSPAVLPSPTSGSGTGSLPGVPTPAVNPQIKP